MIEILIRYNNKKQRRQQAKQSIIPHLNGLGSAQRRNVMDNECKGGVCPYRDFFFLSAFRVTVHPPPGRFDIVTKVRHQPGMGPPWEKRRYHTFTTNHSDNGSESSPLACKDQRLRNTGGWRDGSTWASASVLVND